jgi:predicted ATPase/class 3 adenylate cyclase
MGVGDPGGSGREEQVTHTFLFTDIEGSTRRWQEDPAQMRALLAEHDETLRRAVEAHRGQVFKHTGDGMCAAFPASGEAVAAAAEAQRELRLPVRMAVHTGEAIERDGDFFGIALSRCARLMDAGHGGQVLLSGAAAALLEPGSELLDMGEHRLRDLEAPERIFQLQIPGLPAEFPALRTLDSVRHNLPVLRSSFVGRELELIEVCDVLGGVQLLTLTGIGGCGKTRLALEAAARVIDRFPQGVFFVDLAVVTDSELIPQAVAGAIGLQLVEANAESLAGYLAGRHVLLVLDNCEHVVDACAELVDALLGRCGELHILATSREPLGVDGERVFRVPSLSLETDAVQLFVDRARAAGAQLDPSGESSVAEICRRLDGIPLAIELAAARTTHLGLRQIEERLADRFRLLTGGRRRVQRQQTLAAAIDWSYDLLTDDEQTLFRRLAVFRGSFALEAAEQIGHPDAVDLLGSLVDKSLVNLQLQDDALRYRLLETVRAYAEERLVASGEAGEVRAAHRDWMVAWIESLPVDQLLAGSAGHPLIPEADNLAAALDWSLAEDRLDLVARLASRMVGYWWSYGQAAELASWWRILERETERVPDEVRGHALVVAVQHAMATADFERMATLSEEVVASSPADSWMAAFGWSMQALYWTYADAERGRRCIDEGVRVATAAGAPLLEAMTATWTANLLTGDPERDERLGGVEFLGSVLSRTNEAWLGEAYLFLAIIAALGDTATASRLLNADGARTPLQRFGLELLRAVIAMQEGRLDAARDHLRSMAKIVREHAIPLGESACLTGFAALAAAAGDFETASRHLASVRAAAPWPFRTPVDTLVYRQTARVVREALDHETARRCREAGAAVSVSEALDHELSVAVYSG